MRQIVGVEVQPGKTLQLTVDGSPVGPAVTVPAGVTSITVVFRDTATFEAARARRRERRLGGGVPRRRQVRDDE